jgi:DNA-directed RNA polymerase subunit H (RpoH/RPB5)
MLISPYRFHIVHPIIHPVRLLTLSEKNEILELFTSSNSALHTVNVNDWLCSELGAEVDDIICIKFPSNYVYRKVINRKLII